MHQPEDSDDEEVFCPICLIPIQPGFDFTWVESDINKISNKLIGFIKEKEFNK